MTAVNESNMTSDYSGWVIEMWDENDKEVQDAYLKYMNRIRKVKQFEEMAKGLEDEDKKHNVRKQIRILEKELKRYMLCKMNI